MLPGGGRRRTDETCCSYLTLCLTLLLDLSVSLILCLYNIPSSLSLMNACHPALSLTFDALLMDVPSSVVASSMVVWGVVANKAILFFVSRG